MTVHNVKIHEGYYQHILTGTKRFEVRLNDRSYQTGDIVYLEEVAQESHAHQPVLTGRVTKALILHISNFMQKENVVVFGFHVLPPDEGMLDNAQPATVGSPGKPVKAGGESTKRKARTKPDRASKPSNGKNRKKPAGKRSGKNDRGGR